MINRIICKKTVLFSLFLLAGIFSLEAESFRVSKVHEISVIQSVDSESTEKLGINEEAFC